MSTLFRPVPITSAEQAEALPIGTVALQPWGHGTTARTLTNGRWITPSGAALPHTEAVGFMALVPIEAEEERAQRIKYSPRGYETDVYSETRLVTPWISRNPTESAGEKVE